MSAWNWSVERTGSATSDQIVSANVHAYVGVGILLLVFLRLYLRWAKGVPASPSTEPAVFQLASKFAHASLYLLLVSMPLSGMAAYYFGFGTAGDVHADILKVVIWILIGAHLLGALFQQFYWKTNVLRRMTVG
jgi:cytochrome b561